MWRACQQALGLGPNGTWCLLYLLGVIVNAAIAGGLLLQLIVLKGILMLSPCGLVREPCANYFCMLPSDG